MPSEVLFDAGRQARKVRAVLWFCLAVGGGAVWWGITLARSYGLAPADGGVLAPVATRLAVGGGVGLFGLACAAGLLLYARQYIAQIRRGPQADTVVIRTLRPTGTRDRTYHIRDIAIGRRREGRAGQIAFDGGFPVSGIEVAAPWQTVRVPDRWLPLVLDGQGTFHAPVAAVRHGGGVRR